MRDQYWSSSVLRNHIQEKIIIHSKGKNIIHYWSSSLLCPCPRENHPLRKFICVKGKTSHYKSSYLLQLYQTGKSSIGRKKWSMTEGHSFCICVEENIIHLKSSIKKFIYFASVWKGKMIKRVNHPWQMFIHFASSFKGETIHYRCSSILRPCQRGTSIIHWKEKSSI